MSTGERRACPKCGRLVRVGRSGELHGSHRCPDVAAPPRHLTRPTEAGLNRELATRHDIGPAEVAALRSQARAIDGAEQAGDVDAVTRGNAVYLNLRTEAGLSAAGAKPTDDFEQLMARALRPTPGDSDTAHH